MKLTGNTIFITGGGSGIGRALAEALHKLGNQVIVAGRRRRHLDAVIKANPGMSAIELDVEDPASISRAAVKLVSEHPKLNVLINNAGIMQADRAGGKMDDALLLATVNTNLIGSIRMTSALIEHLKTQDDAVVAYTSSVLGFVPLAFTAVYSATKANEIIVEAAKPLRGNPGPGEHSLVNAFNAHMLALFAEQPSGAAH